MVRFQQLPLHKGTTSIKGPPPRRSALEYDFPVVEISTIARSESWRKEVHRPASHTHKWWAQRLGSVFRAVIIGAYSETASETLDRINQGFDLRGVKILDSFAGSGTTLVEAQKLGAYCTGVDINPVACLVQRQALQPWDDQELHRLMKHVESESRQEIDELHVDRNGNTVLYYFWVAGVRCPDCDEIVDLFSNYVFAKHAYPTKHPRAQAICATCGSIETVDLSKGLCECINGHQLDQRPPVSGQKFTCSSGHTHRTIDALNGSRPCYRMYAKLVLEGDEKKYRPIDEFDRSLYEEASRQLENSEGLLSPTGNLEDGHNTRQAMRWGFTEWSLFFNDRQLYSLGLLGASIRDLPSSPEREALCALFSGTLEFNNLFCSFKGEGTGAVRHMFSHHILKPERTPLEAHPWGTPRSSGSFSTLFNTRLLRARDYKFDPHDIVLEDGEPKRVHGISQPLTEARGKAWEVISGDSSKLPHGDETFDLVVTDPPYFDNVHYSELADFFHSWLVNLQPFDSYEIDSTTTRSSHEVQNTDAERFGDALSRVLREACRVLKAEGLLVFSFHHGTSKAWREVTRALISAGLVVTSVQPVKAEMSTSSTKNGSKEPNDLDSFVICRKRDWIGQQDELRPLSIKNATDLAEQRLRSLSENGIRVGIGDVRSIVTGSVMVLATWRDFQDQANELMCQAERLASLACSRWTL